MMESAHLRHPSFGFRWEFQPGEDLSQVDELERLGFSHWSLRVETFLKYGGPLTQFLEKRAKHAQLRLYSDVLPWAPVVEWEPVHALATAALLENSGALRLTCRRELPEVPDPQWVLECLLKRLPLATELSLLTHDENGFAVIRRAGPISATVQLHRWRDEFHNLEHAADMVAELEIDPLVTDFSDADVARQICRLLERSRSNATLDVTFVLPPSASRYREAAARAEQVRKRVLSMGWKK